MGLYQSYQNLLLIVCGYDSASMVYCSPVSNYGVLKVKVVLVVVDLRDEW